MPPRQNPKAAPPYSERDSIPEYSSSSRYAHIGGMQLVGDVERKTVMHVEGENGARGDCLISTATTDNFCSEEFAKANGKEPSGETIQRGDHGGNTGATLGKINIIFKIEGEMEAQTFNVVRGLTWEVVLGGPWIQEHYPLSFALNSRSFRFGTPKKDITVQLHVPRSNLN